MTTKLAGGQWIVSVVAALLAGHAAIASTPAGQDPQRGQAPDRAAFMRQHFAAVMTLHEAVTRGDLSESRRIASDIAARPAPEGIAQALEPYVTSMQAAAQRISGDSRLEDVAASTAAMLATCGDCHRAAGTMPAPASPTSPAVGGLVGHMLEHQRGIDLMVQGLTVPSTSAWNKGADSLASAPLQGKDLPRDPELTRAVRSAEVRVHQLAEGARNADDTRSRIYVYSELIQSCATCHTLHHKIWGPRRQ
jgi:mono/diheme cytochrome c family protein